MTEQSAKPRVGTVHFHQGPVLTSFQAVLGGGRPPTEAFQKAPSNSGQKHLVVRGPVAGVQWLWRLWDVGGVSI